MATELRIPTLGESVNDGVIVRWIKNDGDAVQADEPLFELETDKASIEIPSPSTGVLTILRREGDTVKVGDVVARIDDGAPAAAAAREEARTPAPEAPNRPERSAPEPAVTALSPAVRRLVEEHGIDPQTIRGTGRGGRLTKADVLAHLERSTPIPPEPASPGEAPRVPEAAAGVPATARPPAEPAATVADEQRVPMTRIRQRIAERLVQAQQTAAILTTFNEVDMSAVLDLRSRYRRPFEDKHGVGLGFMSFFARASVAALVEMPIVNAEIDGTDIVYRSRTHLGIAVGTERGLVVPVVRNAAQLSFAELEREIERLAGLARQNRLGIDDLSGGTFTLSNGGVYGSLLSTPILNPPQSAILGMHKIEKRPIVVDDEIVVRPMMYLALSYDHRLIDGADAVTFLVRIKERIEDPARLLLDV